jgi:hypothetical protein
MLNLHSILAHHIKHKLTVGLSQFLCSRMNKLVYLFVPNKFVIGHVFLKLLIKRLAVAMVNKPVVVLSIPTGSSTTDENLFYTVIVSANWISVVWTLITGR